MDAGGFYGFGEEQRERLGKGNAGVRHADENFRRRAETLVGNDGGGRAGFGARKKFLVFREGEVAGFGLIGGGKAGQNGVAIAKNFARKMFRNVSSGKRHI